MAARGCKTPGGAEGREQSWGLEEGSDVVLSSRAPGGVAHLCGQAEAPPPPASCHLGFQPWAPDPLERSPIEMQPSVYILSRVTGHKLFLLEPGL